MTAVLLAAFLFAGCNDGTENTEPQVRASIKFSSTNMVRAAVFVEGPNGNSLTGALVTVKNDRNILTQLPYESSTSSYNGVIEEVIGNYTVEVKSILSKKVTRLKIPYSLPSGAPNVTVFQDEDGNLALRGQSLSSNRRIQITWFDCGEGVVYQVAIKSALRTVYSVSTEACILSLLPDTLPVGAYLLEIAAQKIEGDVTFTKKPYYSASYKTIPSVNCDVK